MCASLKNLVLEFYYERGIGKQFVYGFVILEDAPEEFALRNREVEGLKYVGDFLPAVGRKDRDQK